jgi:hypothetical protein
MDDQRRVALLTLSPTGFEEFGPEVRMRSLNEIKRFRHGGI